MLGYSPGTSVAYGGQSVIRGASKNTCSDGFPVLPNIPSSDSIIGAGHAPVKEDLSQIQTDTDMFGQAIQEPKVYGRRKFKEPNPPTEDIFGNKIQTDYTTPAAGVQPQSCTRQQRPAPQIDHSLMNNIRACMDRNNKRALADISSTIARWDGGSTMTRRMLTKILKHSGLHLPNETVRILFDRLDVFSDGTVDLPDFFRVFKDAENSMPHFGEDPGQISRTRRAEMQNRAAPWATF